LNSTDSKFAASEEADEQRGVTDRLKIPWAGSGPSTSPARRLIRSPAGLALVGIVLLVVSLNLVDWAAELLWFRALGYEVVFWRLRLAEVAMFAIAFIPVFAYVLVNLLILAKLADLHTLLRGPHPAAGAPQIWPTTAAAPHYARQLTPLLILGSAAVAAMFGFGFAGAWDRLLRLVWAQNFGSSDPIYARDIGFYLFALPFLNLVQVSLVLLTLGGTLVLGLAYLRLGALRFDAKRYLAADPNVLRHLIANAVLLLAASAWGYYLDRFDLLTRSSGAVFGAGYTDVHIVLVGLWVAMWATLGLICILLWAAATEAPRFAMFGIGAYAAVVLLALEVIPAGFQRLVVEPNELELETPFLRHNIALTRAAYGLDKIDVRFHTAEKKLNEAGMQENKSTVDNIRIWDHRPLSQTFRQLQQIRTYYAFSEVDVDRYWIDKDYRQVMLAARELSADFLAKSGSWVNRHLQYTHGYGLAMCLAAEKDDQGGPVFTIEDLPPRSSPGLAVSRPEIYYGSEMSGYQIVPTTVKELDYPKGDQNFYSSYAGHGGVLLDSFWKKALFAWHQFDMSIVLSSYLSPQSRIQLWRPVQERVSRIAPFLKLDRDPYLVLDQGRLFWIQDAYTVADGFPYSEPTDDGFSYIRNSAKIVVDAYQGDVNFYVVDPADPVLRVYEEALPGLFRSLDEMPPGLRQHLRYPQDLFEVQVDKFNTYHMTVPQVFYNREDVWAPPREKFGGQTVQMEPYYVLMKLPGETRLGFLLMTPVTPTNRDNMIAWIAARSDVPGYGQLIVYKLSKDNLILGPLQIEATIDQDTTIARQLTLWDQRGSRVIRGNLLVVPIDQSFLYVEPVFLLASGTNIPQLKRVIVSDGQRLAMESTLADALKVVFGAQPATPKETPAPPALPSAAQDAMSKADQALRQGDWSAFGREWERLKSLLQK
jgi:uncharacterized membrane protein (UPF0182 family)